MTLQNLLQTSNTQSIISIMNVATPYRVIRAYIFPVVFPVRTIDVFVSLDSELNLCNLS